ncbi:hypothetical protein Nos7524_3939 [Nostoc sp. PCC 7524]|uniref:hypothetical protein n=1 Tax=Nostoc sp. (strain ATCC 29411 / PCC 7524) TaxID=28072 RepID=UPI00029EF8F6|nr:hypothetical protein [Nostoc sp. PCC 7524]AFY49712.1 hypothetical protein Nos7524_3939 [Nostoc sp. PCC 7524]
MWLKKVGGLVAILSLSFSGIANAQTTNNTFYLQVGSNKNGDPIVLDVASVKGTEYTLLEQHGDTIIKRTLLAACSQGRLFSRKFALYASNGRLTRVDKVEQEIFPQPRTADANSMEIVCRVADSDN